MPAPKIDIEPHLKAPPSSGGAFTHESRKDGSLNLKNYL